MAKRKCPFCKKDIESGIEKCPHCNRVLIERVAPYSANPSNNNYSSQVNNNAQKRKWTFLSTIGSFFKRLTKKRAQKVHYVYQYDKWKRNRKIVFITIGLFVFIGLSILIGVSNNNATRGVGQQQAQTTSQPTIHNPVVSLPNGTIIYSATGYLNGLGKLYIDNGTDQDSVAKLVSGTKKSIFTVYIKAHNNYTINDIAVGGYDLIFANGIDWDSTNGTFLTQRSFSKFDENFDFTVREENRSDGTYKVYSTYRVTLNPVVGGNAQTNSISESEFRQL